MEQQKLSPSKGRNPSLVSVVIPTRARPQFLARALESVCAQSYPHIEAVVVDENTPDSDERQQTAAVIENYRSRGGIIYLSDRLPSDACRARNDAIAASRGDLIAFLDDDDFWDQDKISRQVDVFRAAGEDTGLVYTGLQIVDNKETSLKYRRPVHKGYILKELLVENVINTLSSVMVKRSVVDDVGGFDSAFPSRQDLDLFIRVAQKYRIDFIPQPLTFYTNLNNDSISKNYQKKLQGRELILQKYQDLYRGQRRILSLYHYGTAKLSLKHEDYPGVLKWLRRSITSYPTLKALLRYIWTLVRH